MKRLAVVAAVVVLPCVSGARADVVMETVPVGNFGNAGEMSGGSAGGWGLDRICGAVDYAYNIGKYEVTAGQYTEFLNAVAATDPYGLYHSSMHSLALGCQITRHGSDGNYTYDFSGRPSGAEADWVNRPVNYVSWGDAARFANWLHNGQPTGEPSFGTTESGSYDLSATQDYYGPDGETPAHGSDDWYALNAALLAIIREPDATWVIPSEDEWYKSAYHKNDGDTGNYYDFPTSSDSVPGYVNYSGDLSGTGTPFTDGGTDPGNYVTYDGDFGTLGIGYPYFRTEVGEWENSDSPYGTSDQGGNMMEWNDTVSGFGRGLRGGSFNYAVNDLHEPGTQVSNGSLHRGGPFACAVVQSPSCDTASHLDSVAWPSGAG